jgi:hypothetical protein
MKKSDLVHRTGRLTPVVSIAAAATLLVGFGTTGSCFNFDVSVLSSPAEYVSGGDARVAIEVP